MVRNLSAVLLVALATSVSATNRDAESDVPLDVRRFELIPTIVEQAIAEKKLPGAVVLIGQGDRIVFERAIGNRSLVPSTEPMTTDTIFDVASLTKGVATATSIMILVEDGRLRLNDRI
jgi:CubicO group peptidase (beta-lactamase class C family)